MERRQALELIQARVKNKNLLKHMLAVEALMKHLARRWGEDEEFWGLSGLIHDLDVEATADAPEKHGLITERILRELGEPESLIQAVLAHCGRSECSCRMDRALYAADPLTGMIVACALVAKDRKLSNVDADFVERRMKEKRFAMGVKRGQIEACEKLGIPLPEFIALGLTAMGEISGELGL